MTKPKPKGLEEENMRLRLKVEQLEAQVRQERRRADQHAHELAVERQHHADYLQKQANRWNGVGR